MENTSLIKDLPDGRVAILVVDDGDGGYFDFKFHLWKDSPLRRLFEAQGAFEFLVDKKKEG